MKYFILNTAKKTKFYIKDFFSKWTKSAAELFTFTEEILNGKLHFLCSESSIYNAKQQCKV